MIEITKGGRATLNGPLVEYQLVGQQEASFSIGESVRVRGGFAEVVEGEVMCIEGEVKAKFRSKLSMFGGRVTITDSEVRLPTGAEDCLIFAHGNSKVYLSMGIRMCEISADGETIVYVPGDSASQMTRGLYSCNIDLQEGARIEYLS
jgi:hypothetical protein